MEQPGPTLSDEQWAAIKAALNGARKIEAIKLYREATGLGLKESKDAIDLLDAELKKTQPEKFQAAAKSGSGCGSACLLFALGIWLLKTQL